MGAGYLTEVNSNCFFIMIYGCQSAVCNKCTIGFPEIEVKHEVKFLLTATFQSQLTLDSIDCFLLCRICLLLRCGISFLLHVTQDFFQEIRPGLIKFFAPAVLLFAYGVDMKERIIKGGTLRKIAESRIIDAGKIGEFIGKNDIIKH